MYTTQEFRFICGSRRVTADSPDGPWRVVCATCGAGGGTPHRTIDAATSACVRDSNKPCRTCGAE